MVVLHAEQRCNVIRRVGAEIDSVASVVPKCEISISVNPLTVYIAELTVNTRSGMVFRGNSSMRFQKTIAAFVATVGISSSALGGNTDNFPRLGGCFGGGAQNYDSTFQTYAAHLHVFYINGGWDGWEQSRGYSKQSVISSIKAQSKINSRVFQFTSANDVNLVAAGSASPEVVNQVNSMKWWLYVLGTSGTMVTDYPGSGQWSINMTSASPLDPATGLSPYGWYAKFENDYFHLGLYAGTSAAPSLDGFYIDNVFWSPRVNGDWLRTGQSTQSDTNSTTRYNFRAGEKTYFDYLATAFPSGVHGGNVADWSPNNGPGTTSIDPLTGQLGLGLFESAIGNTYSVDTYGGSALMQQQYQFLINNLKSPAYLIVSQDYVTFTGSDNYGPNWQAMRYGIAATLMNNGYYYANTNPNLYDETAANRLWFDEYDGGGVLGSNGVVTGGLGVGYLGQPSAGAAGAVQTAPWSNGVWKREFANGIALWNPKGNGTQTVSLSGLGNLKHLSGSQNPSLNNGATVTGGTVTLQDRDGLILLRLTTGGIPNSPSALQLKVN